MTTPARKPILCVDFDGVIHSYSSPWERGDIIRDPPVPGALSWLLKAQEFFDVQIYSSRSIHPFGVDAMRTWLTNFAMQAWGDGEIVDRFLAELKFPVQKPAAFLTIDDRAICFEGDFAELGPVEKLLQFKPWNKRTRSAAE